MNISVNCFVDKIFVLLFRSEEGGVLPLGGSHTWTAADTDLRAAAGGPGAARRFQRTALHPE